jgi:hypothetical protein
LWEGYKLDIGFGKSYKHVRPLGSHDWTFDRHAIDLIVVLSFLSFIFKIRVGASVIVLMVLKVGKLVLCCEDSWCYGGGGSGLGSNFG